MSRVQASPQQGVSLSQVGCPGNLEGGLDRGEELSDSFLQLLAVVQLFCPSVVSDSLRPQELQHAMLPCPSPTPLMSIKSVMPSNHLILCHPLLLLPSVSLRIKVFSNESALHIRWPKYWSFSFSISSSMEYSGWVSFGIDCFDLLAV